MRISGQEVIEAELDDRTIADRFKTDLDLFSCVFAKTGRKSTFFHFKFENVTFSLKTGQLPEK